MSTTPAESFQENYQDTESAGSAFVAAVHEELSGGTPTTTRRTDDTLVGGDAPGRGGGSGGGGLSLLDLVGGDPTTYEVVRLDGDELVGGQMADPPIPPSITNEQIITLLQRPDRRGVLDLLNEPGNAEVLALL